MYRIYQTEALVVESTPRGEADKSILLFTRELGMLFAHARGIRHLKSKLRFTVQPLSFVEVALVKGRDVWRMTSALPSWNMYASTRHDREKRLIALRVSKLLKRLLQGEEAHPLLFDTVKQGFGFLESSTEDLKNFEAVLVLRVLHALGYVGDAPVLQPFIKSQIFSETLVSAMESHRKEAIAHINRSLKETHL